MNDDETTNTELTMEDVDALRFLLHNVRGLSAISTANGYTLNEEELIDE